MTRDKSLSINPFSECIDLRYYASTFSDKQKILRLQEQKSVRRSLDESFFKIKSKPFSLINDACSEDYRDLRCRNCFDTTTDESFKNNYYLNILDINQLFSLRSTKISFKYSRLLFSKVVCSIDVANRIPTNNELLALLEEECKNDRKEVDRATYQFLMTSVMEACRRFSYDLSTIILKIIGCGFYAFSSLFLSRMIVSSTEVEHIKKAREKNLPVVYLLKNSSRIDWFIVLLSLLFLNMKIPVVLRHGNVKSRFLRWIFKKCGVIFVRPVLQKEYVDNAKERICDEAWLLYIEELTRANNHFILDLHTPSGDPDEHSLSLIIDSINRRVTEDVLVTQVIVNRENNVGKFVLEQWNTRYIWTNIFNIFRGKFNSGTVKINFFKPFSLKNLINTSNGKSTELLPEEIKSSVTPKIVSHMKYDFCRMHPIMTTDLISYLLLKKYRKGVLVSNLVEDTSVFIREFHESRKRMGFTGRPHDVIKHAVEILGPRLVSVENKNGENYLTPILKLPATLVMAHHTHETMMHFMVPAVVFTSISMLFPKEFESAFKDNKEFKFTYDQLLNQAERLVDILQFEFTFEKFCRPFSDDLQEALQKLTNDDLIIKVEKLMTEEERWGHRLAKYLENSDEYDDYNPYDEDGSRSPSPPRNIRDDSESYVLSTTGVNSILRPMVFYRNALKPYFDAYAMSAEHLKTLNNKQVPTLYYCETLADKIRLKLNETELMYPETFSMNLLQNTVKLFEKWRVIDRNRVHDVEFISLLNEFNDSTALKQIVEKTKTV